MDIEYSLLHFNKTFSSSIKKSLLENPLLIIILDQMKR